MFAKSVIGSDDFLDMPATAKVLYFYLMSEADDDGFVDKPKGVMRLVGASSDDMKILLAKQYAIAFETGVVVIKHWKIHNYIRKDLYKPTKHIEEKDQIILDTDTYQLRDETVTETLRGRDETVSLGKDRIGKDSIDKYICTNEDSFEQFWKAYPKKKSKTAAQKAWKKINPNKDLVSQMMSALDKAKKTNDWLKDNGQFIPYPATWLNQRRWEDELEVGQQPTKQANTWVNPKPTDEALLEQVRQMCQKELDDG